MTNEQIIVEQQLTTTSADFINDEQQQQPYYRQRQKGVALKRSLEEHAPSASGPEPKKMAGNQPCLLATSPTSDYTEEWSVPDKMVGLIIGRDGKQIAKLQQESQCKVQLSSDSNGTPERQCVLTGTKQNVLRAKEMINALISRGQEASHKAASLNGANPNEISVEVPCPANKAGLIIGRNGETIRGLQQRAGVKMVLLQESFQGNNTIMEKPIRITGEPHKVEIARRMVLDLITSSLQNGGGGGPGRIGVGGHMDRGGFPHLGQTGPAPVPGEAGVVQEQLSVPQQAVGVVIGKQGDMIKRIQIETGARVQFTSAPDDNLPDRICVVTGQSSQVIMACSQISDLISSVLRRDDESGGGHLLGGMGRGAARGGRGGRGGYRGGRGGGGRGGHMGGGGGPLGSLPSPSCGPDEQQFQMHVPASKCGLVIGKGGETIRNIMSVSGAHIELSRSGGPNAAEGFFTIRGSPQAIETAQQLISEKVGSAGLMSSSNGTPSGYQPSYGGQFAQSAASQYGTVAQAPNQSAWGQPGPYQQTANGTAQWGQPPTAATPNGDLSKTDPSAWGTFYPYGYTQQPGGQQPTPGAPTPTGSTSNPSAPSSNNVQTDYSQAWIDYYRQIGMYQEADFIEHQFRGGAAAASPAAQQQGGAPGGPSAVVQNGAPWGSPYATPAGAYGGAPSGAQPYSTYGYPSA